MSRTDKTSPYWTQADWWEPVHVFCEHDHRGRYGRTRRECDLPSEPTRHNPSPMRRKRWTTACTWDMVWPSYRDRRYRHWTRRGVPKWFVDHVWHNAERVRVRDLLTHVRKDWVAWCYFDGDIPNHQARNTAKWYWD